MLKRGISETTGAGISLQASADGTALSGLPDGQQTFLFAQEAVLVHHLASQDKKPARNVKARSVSSPGRKASSKNSVARADGATAEIYGLSSEDALRAEILTSSMASRLQAILDVNGSPEYELTWRDLAIPQQPLTFRLRASARRTSAKDSGGSLAETRGWPTCSSRDWKDTPGMSKTGINPDGTVRNRCDQLPRVAALAGWNTPTSEDWKTDGLAVRSRLGTDKMKPCDQRLRNQVFLTGWATPRTITGGGGGARSGNRSLGARRAVAATFKQWRLE